MVTVTTGEAQVPAVPAAAGGERDNVFQGGRAGRQWVAAEAAGGRRAAPEELLLEPPFLPGIPAVVGRHSAIPGYQLREATEQTSVRAGRQENVVELSSDSPGRPMLR